MNMQIQVLPTLQWTFLQRGGTEQDVSIVLTGFLSPNPTAEHLILHCFHIVHTKDGLS